MKCVNEHHYWNHIPLRQIFTYSGKTFPHWSSPLFVMRVWSSVRSGLLFSHWMYFFHISTCWASWGEFWGGTEGAFLSSPFITVSYSWITQTESSKLVYKDKSFCDASERFKTDQWHSPSPLSWHSCSLYFYPRSSFWPSVHLFPVHKIDRSVF